MKEVVGYSNYLVSEDGNVYSKNINKLMKTHVGSDGYARITLSKNGKPKRMCVHRIVALAFVPNPNNYPEINHKDMNKTNNTVENLEWCTRRYNHFYGGDMSPASVLVRKRVRPVCQMKDGKVIATYISATDAQRATGVNQSNIIACCRNKKYFRTAGGYEWKYK